MYYLYVCGFALIADNLFVAFDVFMILFINLPFDLLRLLSTTTCGGWVSMGVFVINCGCDVNIIYGNIGFGYL